MAQDDRLGESTFVTLAGALAGGRTDELRETLAKEIVPNASGEAVDATLSGTILGLARSDLSEAVTQAGEQTDKPVIHARERELADGSIGVHLFVSEPEARVFVGGNSVLIKIGQWQDEQPLGFKPGRVERLQGEDAMDAVAEFMVYPTTYSPPAESIETDMPPEESAESDETDTSDGESSASEEVEELIEEAEEEAADDEE